MTVLPPVCWCRLEEMEGLCYDRHAGSTSQEGKLPFGRRLKIWLRFDNLPGNQANDDAVVGSQIWMNRAYFCLIYSNTIHRNNDWRNPLYYLQSTDLESLDSLLQISSYIHFWQSQTCISYGFFDPQSTFMQPPVQPPYTPTSPVVKPRSSPNVHHQGELHPF